MCTAVRIPVVGVVLLVAALGLAACGNLSNSPDLVGTNWGLDELGGADALAGVSVTMRLTDDGQISGSSGCNRFTGTWQGGSNRALTIGPVASTLMACSDPVDAQEQAFLAALENTARYRIDDDELYLLDGSGAVLAEFEVLQTARLTRTNWEVVMFNAGQQALVGPLDGTRMTAVFGTDKRVSGNAGCNTYSTDYLADRGSMTIAPEIISTRMACDEPIMEQEMQFLTILPQAATYELGADTLYLRAADGSLLVMFRERD
ncbi:MAG: hypothetical protein DCC58_05905 [Chloroflexi bacterium]|nr:MAG: hypothetical protein DCC58_05905 [Chloroflexota bacterium]